MIGKILNVCKNKNKNLTEDEVKSSLKILIPDTISHDDFKKSIYLMVRELYNFDNKKYKIIMHIAEKAKNEIDKDVFLMNYTDLKSELRLWI